MVEPMAGLFTDKRVALLDRLRSEHTAAAAAMTADERLKRADSLLRLARQARQRSSSYGRRRGPGHDIWRVVRERFRQADQV